MPPGVYRTIREQIVEQLRRDVLSGKMVEGEALREEDLAKRFGVSRGPIRDALLQLSQEGLLVSRPNCGARVARQPSLLIQPLVISFRRQIEQLAIRQAFPLLTPQDFAELAAILAKFHDCCLRNDQAELIEHDMAFHRWFVERVGDPDLVAMWLTIVTRMRLRYTRHTSLLESYAEHVAVYDALQRGDLETAARALEANVQ